MTSFNDFSISELVPHRDTMSFLTHILDYSDNTLSALVTIHEDMVFLNNNSVPAWVGIEFMAQSIAAWSGINCRLHNHPVSEGFLLGTRSYKAFSSEFLLHEKLVITVTKTYQEQTLGVFNCTIHSDKLLAEAALNVYQPNVISS